MSKEETIMLGENSREIYQNETYDVQTQELGEQEKSIETRVYRNGKVLTSVMNKCPDGADVSALQEMISEQHENICKKVREGSYELTFLWMSRGIIAFEEQDYLQALESFESVLSIEETNPEANTYLGHIHASLADSEADYQKVSEEYLEQIESLERTGRHMEAGRKRAILARICPQKTSSAPQNPVNLQEMPIYTKKANISPKYFLIASVSLILILSAGLITTDGQRLLDPAYHYLLGKEYLEKDRIYSARNLFYNVIEQSPGSQEALTGLWETFEEKGDYPEAIRMFSHISETSDDSPLVSFFLAESYRHSSQFADAIAYYQKARKLGAEEIACKLGWGLCLLEQRKISSAIKMWKNLLNNGSEDYRVDYCLGLAYQAKNRPGKASLYYAKALKKNPDSPHIYRSLGNCLEKLHQKNKAKALLEKADKLDELAQKGEKPHNSPINKRFPFMLI